MSRDDIDTWVGNHVRGLGVATSAVVFRSGRLAAVYGVVLKDGGRVAVKVHRRRADVAHMSPAVACQRALAAAGFPCPRPLDGPTTTDRLTAVIETLVAEGEAGAPSLFEQVELLRGHALDDLVDGGPRLEPLRARPMAPTS
jgi:Phosphotransferase enzyme family